MAKDVLFIPHNHFDPIWRRCFDRDAVYHGVTVRSYAEVEEHIINAWLDLADDGFTFDEGQTAVWRKYLERNPERKEDLRKAAADGKLNLVLAGETVQDSVMGTAEGLVRNFLVAMPMYMELVERDHPGLKMAWLEDAFGNNPNYPQILRGVGAEVACRLGYRPCPEDIWVGIDGSHILCIDHRVHSAGGTFLYHPPCPDCSGKGCTACDDTGLILHDYLISRLQPGIENAAETDVDWMTVIATTEEAVPARSMIYMVAELNEKYPDSNIHFATYADAYARCREDLMKVDAERDDTPTVDLNPAMPGCMVSRIKTKQRNRAIAYKLVCAEAKLATESWHSGVPEAQPEALSEAWRDVTFTQFHDAITGTLIDSGYTELMDMFDRAEAIADQLLPPETISASEETFTQFKDESTTITLGEMTINFDLKGILGIEIGGIDPFNAAETNHLVRRSMRIGELTLGQDFGDAWGKRIDTEPFVWGSIYLGDYNTDVSLSADAIRWQGAYTGGDYKVSTLEWTVTALASADGKRLEFVSEVDWDTSSRRIRMVVPTDSKDNTATFEIPFGFIDRTFDREKVTNHTMEINSQEFGTLHWVRKALDDKKGVALFNKGLPCHRFESGLFDLSLVRSPEYTFSANIPGQYEFWDLDGLRDTGKHVFEFAIMPYVDGLSTTELTRIGYDYNRPETLELPFTVEGDVVVTAWTPSEDGNGWSLRLQETAGSDSTVSITFDGDKQISVTNLLEEPTGWGCKNDSYETTLSKHKILTLRISQL